MMAILRNALFIYSSLVFIFFSFNSMASTVEFKADESKEGKEISTEIWKNILEILNLRNEEFTPVRIETIFGKKLSLKDRTKDSYQYIGNLSSGNVFTVILRTEKGQVRNFVFQWGDQISLQNHYSNITQITPPAGVCIEAFDKIKEVTRGRYSGRSYLEGADFSILSFEKRTQLTGIGAANAYIYLNGSSDCLVKVEIDEFSLPPQIIY